MTPTGVDVGALLGSVPDPELPFLTIEDLGILRGWHVEQTSVRVQITPTYSGCPALDAIREDVEKVLRANGFDDVGVEIVLSPPWTTDWMSERGKAALTEHGYVPPGPVLIPLGTPLACPRCGSQDTEELSRFGATACKALHRCRSCREPFEHFKAY